VKSEQKSKAYANGESSSGNWDEDDETSLVIKILEHKHFQQTMSEYARKTCEHVINQLLEKVRNFIYPLIVIITGLILYIFGTSTSSINRLNDSVVVLTKTMYDVQQTLAVMQTNQQNNKENIEKLNEKVYGK